MVKLTLPSFPIAGGCLCGAVRYRVSAPPLSLYACHCTDCQHLSGGMSSMSMPMRASDLTVEQGDLATYAKRADSGKSVDIHFCAACSTRIFHAPSHSPDLVNLKPGTLDDTSWLIPAAHIWTASRATGDILPDGILACPGQPPDRDALYAAFAAATSTPAP
jgi:hypothetical protein